VNGGSGDAVFPCDLAEAVSSITLPAPTLLRSALDQQRRVINDIHKRILAVSKVLEKPSS